MIRGFFEDHEIGQRSITAGRTITEADILDFAQLSGDWHPVHTDADAARRGPFGERIAHGMLLVSMATGLADIDGETGVAFYGIDRLRFVNPAKIGDTIRTISEVAALDPRDETTGVVTSDIRIENQRGELLVIATFRVVVYRRTGEAQRDPAVEETGVLATTQAPGDAVEAIGP